VGGEAQPINVSPPGSPNITAVVPGAAEVTVDWSAPVGNTTVTGYLIEWGFEGGTPGNETAAASNRSAVIVDLLAFAKYQVNVTAFNDVGLGPPSPSVHFTLYAWTRVSGTVWPASASVSVDSIPVPVVAGAYTVNTSLSPHLVAASATNYRTAELVVLPTWNGTSWGNLTLGLLPGTVEGYVAPVTSNVTWNGTAETVAGNGFFSFPVPPSTSGTLAVAYPGLVTWQLLLAVSANATLWENVTLVAPNATLTLHLRPTTAALFVDGAAITTDALGTASVSLGSGTHRLEAVLASYYPYFANVTLRAGENDTVSLNLTALPNDNGTNATARAPNPLADPVVLGLVAGVALLAILVFVLGRRGRAREDLASSRPSEDGIEETQAVDVVDGDPPTS